MGDKKAAKEIAFEQAMGQLEKIVEEMENGELPLDQIINKYEDGMELLSICRDKLEYAGKRIELLTREKSGKVSITSFKSQKAKDSDQDEVLL
ncbi:MAG: exodeoxyribonuclease VII small subunit [Verrucomicrobiota bacterium]